MAQGRVALERSETLDKFAGVWVDSEKTEEYIMRIAGGWAFGVEGASDEKGGVCELSLEQPSPSGSAGVGVRQLVLKTLEGEQKGWTLNDDASSSVRMAWKRAGTPPSRTVSGNAAAATRRHQARALAPRRHVVVAWS